MTGGRARLVGATMLACAAAASSYGALFRGWGWLPPALLAIVVVIGVSEAVRSSRLPTALGPLVATVAAILFGTGYFAGSVAVARIFPGPAAVHRLTTLMHTGADVIHRYAAPVPDRQGAVLLAAIGIAAVALVVDLCALTLDRAVLAGGPLLAVYVVAALLTHHGVGWRVFLLIATGLLLMLAADTAETRRRWGRRFSGETRRAARFRGGVGRGVAVTALSAAVVVPAVLPGLHNITSHGGSGSGDGNGSITTVNPIVSLNAELHQNSDETVLTYRNHGGPASYLRLTALDRFDGRQFTAVELHSADSRKVTPALQLATPAGRHDVITRIQVGPLAEHWAPTPMHPVDMSIPGPWLFDPTSGSIWSSSVTTQNRTYQVETNPDDPTPSQLQSVGWDSYPAPPAGSVGALDRSYPAALPQRVIALAHRLRRATPYATAVAIQNHFLTGGFSYDLNVTPSDSVDALSRFLFQTQVGYCQQYAAAMTLLARVDGIPARVAVGFTAGQDKHGLWTVTGADAHTWPELDFPGVGWLAFEPTPRPDGQTRQPAYAPVRTGKQAPGVRKQPGNAKSKQQPHPKAHANPQHTGQAAGQPAGAHGTSSGSGGLVALAIALVIALALLLPAADRFAGRRRHRHPHGPAAAAHAAWDEVRDSVVDLGFDWPDQRSPRQTVRLLMRSVPALIPAAEALQRIAVAEQQARYAPAVTADVGRPLRADVVAVRQALFARTGRAQRLRAAVLPRSSLRTIRERLRSPRRSISGHRPAAVESTTTRAIRPTRSIQPARPRPAGPRGRDDRRG